MAEKQMHLGFSAHLTGAHPGAWRDPSTQVDADIDIKAYRSLAKLAEAGKFDLFFMADVPAIRTDDRGIWSRYPHFTNVLEPLTALSALAGATERIGLAGTATTTFNEPYNVARQFASLDHVSAGRAAWNVVTTANRNAAGNFGMAQFPPHAERYARAREFVRVVDSLWKTWDEQAFVRDQAAGIFCDPEKMRPTDFKGQHFEVHGALNISRTPQGQPVVIQAGASDDGKELAAETADVVFGSAGTLAEARAYYDDLKGRMDKYGRRPSDLKILAGLPVIVGRTDDEAEEKFRTLQALLPEEVARQRLSADLEADLWDIPFDQKVPLDRIPKSANLHTAYFEKIASAIREQTLTLREMALSYERGTPTLKGSPKRVADTLEEWFSAGAADGFMLLLHRQPADLADFVTLVVPELQKRKLFRQDYAGTTLREHLGLPRLSNSVGRKA